MPACNAGPIGQQHAYHLGNPQVLQRGSLVLALAVQDQRPYELSGAKRPNFVGLSRGGFGNPFDVTTQSGQPLASDISSSIVASMRGRGVEAKVVELKPGTPESEALSQLRAAGAQKSVLLTLRE